MQTESAIKEQHCRTSTNRCFNKRGAHLRPATSRKVPLVLGRTQVLGIVRDDKVSVTNDLRIELCDRSVTTTAHPVRRRYLGFLDGMKILDRVVLQFETLLDIKKGISLNSSTGGPYAIPDASASCFSSSSSTSSTLVIFVLAVAGMILAGTTSTLIAQKLRKTSIVEAD